MPDDYYDSDLDQENAFRDEPDSDKDDTENVGEPFLAPKASFKGDLSPGTVHRVRIEEAHDSELTLVCLGPDAHKSDETQEAEPDSMYD